MGESRDMASELAGKLGVFGEGEKLKLMGDI